MVVPPFGFSIGDFIAGTDLLITLLGAFKEKGGASTKYASETAFLTSLVASLKHLDEYVTSTSQDAISKDMAKLLKTIDGPLDEFNSFLDKYKTSLSPTPTDSTLRKTKATVSYTIKDISGKIDKLRKQVEQPLKAVNSLLLLQVIKSMEILPDKPLQQSQLAQIVEAIKIADIPAELDKQIQILQRSAADHNVRQDDQLQHIKELRVKLDGQIAGLYTAVEEAKNAAAEGQVNADAQLNVVNAMHTSLYAALESRTDKLDTAMKEQTQLILALSHFLEEKVALQERVLAEKDHSEADEAKVEKASWPPATLSAAHLSLTLLSTVVSSIVAVSATKRSQQAQQSVVKSDGVSSRAYPAKDTMTLTSTFETTAKTSPQSAQLRGVTWAAEYRSQGGTQSYTQPKKETEVSNSTFSGVGAWTSTYPGWSDKLSKLDESDPDNQGGGIGSDPYGGTFGGGAGPVIPSSTPAFGSSSGGAVSGDTDSGSSGGYSGGQTSSTSDSSSD